MDTECYENYIELVKSRKEKTTIVPLRSKEQSQFRIKTFQCAKKSHEELIRLLDQCPIGDGAIYEHLVMDIIGSILKNVIDVDNVFMQTYIGNGRSDIEFLFRSHELYQHPSWNDFVNRYGICSIFVETKNMKIKTAQKDVLQIKNYIECAKRGRYGNLISRSGFTRQAYRQLRWYLENQNILIIPITHEELIQLLKISLISEDNVVEFFWRKENFIRRIW